MTAAQQLGEWIAGTHAPALPPAVGDLAQRALLDTLGVALAGRDENASRRIIDFVRGIGASPRCSVWGTGLSSSATEAALANGVMAHVLDYDDVGNRAQGHVSAVLYPALLAAAEQSRADGATLLAAYGVGFEVWARLARAMPMLHLKGWHPTAVLGTLGAAAAVAHLWRLDAQQSAMALAIAASSAAGLTQNFGTDTKSLHVGQAARQGLLAADLARHGFTGAPDVFDGHLPMPAAYFHQAVPSEELTRGLGEGWALERQGLNVKKYPCCLLPQRAIDAAIQLAVDHDIEPAAVTAIDCTVSPLGPKILFYPEPRNGLEAKFSLQHCIAASLIDRKLGLRQFETSRIHAPDIIELRRKVRMDVHEGPATDAAIDDRPDVVTIHMADGRRLQRSVRTAHGHADSPLSWTELMVKFDDASAAVLDHAAKQRVVDTVRSIRTLPDLQPLFEALVPGSGVEMAAA